jgi:molybdate transport system ATP-binding protein
MIDIEVNKTLIENGHQFELSLSIHIAPQTFATIYGPSGAGKTTLLRMLAGLTTPGSGRIVVNGKAWFDSEKKIDLPAGRRGVGLVFQEYALFPNMTVRENLRFALPGGGDASIIDDLLGIMGLADLQNRMPASLSGGQQQRVALARALAPKPELLLLDEPLAALDEQMRIRLQDHLMEVHQNFGLTTLLVSHDISEIFRMSQHIYVLEGGKVVDEGSPQHIFIDNKVSGKFRFTGILLDKQPNEVVCVLSVLVGHHVIKVVSTCEEAEALAVGDKVMVVSKAFNPLVMKLKEG